MSDAHLLRDYLQQKWALPTIISERCVYSHCDTASCQQCADHCPTQAWVLTDESLGLDTTRCNLCGLCVSVCPETAISLDFQAATCQFNQQPTLLLACEKSNVEQQSTGIVPCLHALTADFLTEQYQAGFQQILSCRNDCASCPRYAKRDAFREQLARINQLLQARQAPIIKHAQVNVAQWLQALQTPLITTPVSVSRRSFFRKAALSAIETGLEQLDSPTASTPSPIAWSKRLPKPTQTPSLYAYVPSLDTNHCNACDACIRLCPHQALQLEKNLDKQVTAYVIEPDHCTGCGICVDVCDQQAINVQPMQLSEPKQLALNHKRCKACGTNFHYLSKTATSPTYCAICSQINHHKHLFQVLTD
jgi:Pyruvate/2-oxoacid:ferredoxin oxidoreductase delta subunit